MIRNRRARLAVRALGSIAVGVVVAWASGAGAHAFVSRSEPRTGATIAESPAQVRIWFDGPIESMFASIRVEDRDRRQVDKGDARADPDDRRLLEVGLAPLSPGRYQVAWSVIARDGHPREGTFSFLLK